MYQGYRNGLVLCKNRQLGEPLTIGLCQQGDASFNGRRHRSLALRRVIDIKLLARSASEIVDPQHPILP